MKTPAPFTVIDPETGATIFSITVEAGRPCLSLFAAGSETPQLRLACTPFGAEVELLADNGALAARFSAASFGASLLMFQPQVCRRGAEDSVIELRSTPEGVGELNLAGTAPGDPERYLPRPVLRLALD